VFANLGKAIAAYERTIVHGPSRRDAYTSATLRGDPAARLSSAAQKRGLRLFIGKGDCISCHNGALLSDQHFHNTGVAPRDPAHPDAGRAAAIAKLLADEFNCLGRFSDAGPGQCQEREFIAARKPVPFPAQESAGLVGFPDTLSGPVPAARQPGAERVMLQAAFRRHHWIQK
jgi:cytochrome c peroxidase